MTRKYRVQVFGKAGCQKCDLLKRRLDRLFSSGEWDDFDKQYCDVETEEGLVAFALAQCVNPSRIPALLVTRWNEADGEYVPVENPEPGKPDPDCGESKLYQFLGLQTDYSENGNGVISPKMVTHVLQEARDRA